MPMKTNRLLPVLVLSFSTILLISCKKEDAIQNSSQNDDETTFELSSNQALSDNLTEDANSVFLEAAFDKKLLGNNFTTQPVETANILACANISVSPANSFPKNIVIDFGSGNCTSPGGITRKGKINITLSDSVRKPGSIAIMTFTNYFVNNFKKEGTLTFTNTSTINKRSWKRKVENGKITAQDGKYWLHEGLREIVQIAGTNTPYSLLDDIFLTTGNYKVTNAAGKTRNCFITEALEKKTICNYISSGKLKVEGSNHIAIIDFGNGECDNSALITIDGNTPRTIILR